ncbi:glutamine--fructose-6-phosphate transaminase (isomerizing) [bacterium]|nr:glutamine--fructose-6-phosphate transaminase (isomerizing) [bacterium]MBU4561377.1 glutamine--fructose-6-phosphate transaminase (isomerizing) [bacterium]MCG2676141.1 glutamine--fructose-6-phosphate transaminase (isomerizing) [bacterium]MCG2677333.1 glutamine--fructose-6-phosphate transaminase (isomerizing) [bacterium]
MCGIVGYLGKKRAQPILLEGLKRLEYRGYDSSGIAVLEKKKILLYKKEGKISILEALLVNKKLEGTIGLGHTRWATHGKPSDENAHPHSDCSGDLVVVHNGIIENYLILKEELIKKGHRFKSETDTEVLAHLIEENFKGDLEEATREALKSVEGAYAIGVISTKDPEKLVAARYGSPLIVGVGEKEFFIASDVPAILNHTREIIFLDEGQLATLTPEGVKVTTLDNKKVEKAVTIIEWDVSLAQKNGYKHFMLKEIYEQPRAMMDTLRGRIAKDEREVLLPEISLSSKEIEKIKRLFIIACGTSYHAALIGKFLIENKVGLPVEVDIASEFRYRNPIIDSQTLVMVITQSGETADTLAALRLAKEKKAKTLAITNVVGSTASREADGVLYTHAGPEIAVASTKAFIAQLTLLYLFTIYLGGIRGTIPEEEAQEMLATLRNLPQQVKKILEDIKGILSCARKYFHKRDFLYMGRGINYPIALEGALKLKEISYIHAEGYPAGEMKHGPIALIDEDMPIVAIATQGSVYEKVLSNIEEIKAREGIVIALATEGDKKIKEKADEVIYLPQIREDFTPFLAVIPLQLLAYHIAARRGCDIDQPRNLAKSVTVE